MQDSIHPKRLTLLTASAPARPRNTGDRGAGGRMRGEALPARPRQRRAARAPRRRARRARPPRPPLGRATQPARVRRARARPPRAPAGRVGWRLRGACAPAACPTSRTRGPAGVFSFRTCRNQSLIARVPRRRRRSARSSCRAAASPVGGGLRPPRRRWRSGSRSPCACANTASPSSPTPEPRGRPTSAQGSTRKSATSTERSFARPWLRSPAGAGVQAGPWPRAARRHSASPTDGNDTRPTPRAAPRPRGRRLTARAGVAARGRGRGSRSSPAGARSRRGPPKPPVAHRPPTSCSTRPSTTPGHAGFR